MSLNAQSIDEIVFEATHRSPLAAELLPLAVKLLIRYKTRAYNGQFCRVAKAEIPQHIPVHDGDLLREAFRVFDETIEAIAGRAADEALNHTAVELDRQSIRTMACELRNAFEVIRRVGHGPLCTSDLRGRNRTTHSMSVAESWEEKLPFSSMLPLGLVRDQG